LWNALIGFGCFLPPRPSATIRKKTHGMTEDMWDRRFRFNNQIFGWRLFFALGRNRTVGKTNADVYTAFGSSPRLRAELVRLAARQNTSISVMARRLLARGIAYETAGDAD
jgi:hypothetical protein